MKLNSLEDLYLSQLQEMYFSEQKLTKALSKMAKAASNQELKEAFENHREETEGQAERLKQIFEVLGEKPRAKKCETIVGMIDDAETIISEAGKEEVCDAGLIAAAQKVEHYEIAAYGTLVAYAKILKRQDQESILQEILDEEKAADQKLNQLAEGELNEAALAG